MWDLSSLTTDWTFEPASPHWILNHWTTQKVWQDYLLHKYFLRCFGLMGAAGNEKVLCLNVVLNNNSFWFLKRKGKSLNFFIAQYLKTHCIEIKVKRGFGVLVWTSLGAVHKSAGWRTVYPNMVFPWCFIDFEVPGYSREYGTIEIKEMTMWVFNKTSHVTPKVWLYSHNESKNSSLKKNAWF